MHFPSWRMRKNGNPTEQCRYQISRQKQSDPETEKNPFFALKSANSRRRVQWPRCKISIFCGKRERKEDSSGGNAICTSFSPILRPRRWPRKKNFFSREKWLPIRGELCPFHLWPRRQRHVRTSYSFSKYFGCSDVLLAP